MRISTRSRRLFAATFIAAALVFTAGVGEHSVAVRRRVCERLGVIRVHSTEDLIVTAGLVMFVVEPALRGRYQTMFADRVVRKEYEAIAPHDPALTLPTRVSSRIVKVKGVITAQEVPGPPNAETVVELVEHRDGWGRYRLVPLTGRTHQLRLHMASLGVPIRHDDFYPVLREKPLDDFTDPLQLLAKVLEFTDPVTGEHRRFTSSLSLDL